MPPDSETAILLRRLAGELAAMREDRSRMEEAMREHSNQIERLTAEVRRSRVRVDDMKKRLTDHIDWATRAWRAWLNAP